MLHLGSIRGTSIDVDLSFILLTLLFVATAYDERQGIQYALIWAPILFVSILVHELAHAAAIGLFGYGSSQIVLGGIGGVTMNARRSRPWHDMVISAAGPLASFAIWWGTSLFMARYPLRDPMLVALLPRLADANLIWGIFNLVPVPPLDGGSVVRNFLRLFLSDRISFVITTWLAMITAAVLVVIGFRIHQYFVIVLMGYYLYANWQKWQYFREHGYPGD
ncbi:MAG TPA: M50 family metallopeptidase [Thermoanaerobaculia bacterium]|jgi:Zn-dependent protease|nr:M50 family metallopeptidase [Thermoanaerobaculia bacterium]